MNPKKLLRRLAIPALAASISIAGGAVLAQQQDTPPPPAISTTSQPGPFPIATTYGQSVEHRPLIAYTFGTGSNTTMILASIHGNERNTRPIAELLIAYLTAHPNAYSDCTVTVVPCVNPDGWAHSTRVNAHGVDLNRNFPIGWHSNVPGKLNRGSHALSEPESTALAKLIDHLRPSKIVSIHNPLHLLDPSGARGQALAKVIASHNAYPIPTGGVGYPTPGSLGQFAAQYGAAIVTLELPRESTDASWKQNRGGLLAAIVYKPGS